MINHWNIDKNTTFPHIVPIMVGTFEKLTTLPKLWPTWKSLAVMFSMLTIILPCLKSKDEYKGLIVMSSSGSTNATKTPTFSPLLTFPRHVSQERAVGVDKVGAAPRREISIKTKSGAVGEGEYGDLKGMGLSQPRGLRRGARGKRRGGLRCLGGGTTGNDRIIKKSIWQEINTVWARSPRGSKPDIVENYNKRAGRVTQTCHSALLWRAHTNTPTWNVNVGSLNLILSHVNCQLEMRETKKKRKKKKQTPELLWGLLAVGCGLQKGANVQNRRCLFLGCDALNIEHCVTCVASTVVFWETTELYMHYRLWGFTFGWKPGLGDSSFPATYFDSFARLDTKQMSKKTKQTKQLLSNFCVL